MKSLLLQIVIFLSVLFVVTADNNVNSAEKSPNSDRKSLMRVVGVMNMTRSNISAWSMNQ